MPGSDELAERSRPSWWRVRGCRRSWRDAWCRAYPCKRFHRDAGHSADRPRDARAVRRASGRSVGLIGRGRRDGLPISQASTVVRGGAALGDRPDDERLAATGVAGDEHAGHAGHVGVVAGDVAARVELDAELRRRSSRSGPRKPIASSTSCAGISRSLPSTWLEAALAHDSTSCSRSAAHPALARRRRTRWSTRRTPARRPPRARTATRKVIG